MENEERPNIGYQYLANRKSYFLGIRPNHIKIVLISTLALIVVGGVWVTVLTLLCWLIVGYIIDTNQRQNSRDYIGAKKAWLKTRSVKIHDVPGSVLKVFKR